MKIRRTIAKTVREKLEDEVWHAENGAESHPLGWGLRGNFPSSFIPSDRPFWLAELAKAQARLQRHDELTALIHQSIAECYKENPHA